MGWWPNQSEERPDCSSNETVPRNSTTCGVLKLEVAWMHSWVAVTTIRWAAERDNSVTASLNCSSSRCPSRTLTTVTTSAAVYGASGRPSGHGPVHARGVMEGCGGPAIEGGCWRRAHLPRLPRAARYLASHQLGEEHIALSAACSDLWWHPGRALGAQVAISKAHASSEAVSEGGARFGKGVRGNERRFRVREGWSDGCLR